MVLHKNTHSRIHVHRTNRSLIGHHHYVCVVYRESEHKYKYSCLNFETAFERAYNFIRTTIAYCVMRIWIKWLAHSWIERDQQTIIVVLPSWTELNRTYVLCSWMFISTVSHSLCAFARQRITILIHFLHIRTSKCIHCERTAAQRKLKMVSSLRLSLSLDVLCLYSPLEHPFVSMRFYLMQRAICRL